MKKAIAIVSLLAALMLTGCGNQELPIMETLPGTEAAATLPPEETAAEAITVPAGAAETIAQQTGSDPVLDAIIRECGLPFLLGSGSDRDYTSIKIFTDHAEREVEAKYDENEKQKDLHWTIQDRQLTLTGSYQESFALDLETMSAVSQRDGREYTIQTRIGFADWVPYKLADKFGTPFVAKCITDGVATTLTFYEDEVSRRERGETWEKISWEVDPWEGLWIRGGWEENFSINFEDSTLISKTDGRVYQLSSVDGGSKNKMLETIVRECGMPFRLSSSGGSSCEITLYDYYAQRAAGLEEEDGLGWRMKADQLVLAGRWQESFTIDLDAMEATSNDDGSVYQICAVK